VITLNLPGQKVYFSRSKQQVKWFDTWWRKTYVALSKTIKSPVGIASALDSNNAVAQKMRAYFQHILTVDCVRPLLLKFLNLKPEQEQIVLNAYRRESGGPSVDESLAHRRVNMSMDVKIEIDGFEDRVRLPGNHIRILTAKDTPKDEAKRGNTDDAHRRALQHKSKFIKKHKTVLPKLLAACAIEKRTQKSPRTVPKKFPRRSPRSVPEKRSQKSPRNIPGGISRESSQSVPERRPPEDSQNVLRSPLRSPLRVPERRPPERSRNILKPPSRKSPPRAPERRSPRSSRNVPKSPSRKLPRNILERQVKVSSRNIPQKPPTRKPYKVPESRSQESYRNIPRKPKKVPVLEKRSKQTSGNIPKRPTRKSPVPERLLKKRSAWNIPEERSQNFPPPPPRRPA